MKDLKRTNTTDRSPGADPAITMLLRGAYAPPDEEFWGGFEQRLRARLLEQTTSSSWWSVLPQWRSAGLIAATLAIMAAGATVAREFALRATTQSLAAEMAYRTPSGAVEGIPVTISVKSRDSLPDYQPERYLNPFEP